MEMTYMPVGQRIKNINLTQDEDGWVT
jgi:hypothetical protein